MTHSLACTLKHALEEPLRHIHPVRPPAVGAAGRGRVGVVAEAEIAVGRGVPDGGQGVGVQIAAHVAGEGDVAAVEAVAGRVGDGDVAQRAGTHGAVGGDKKRRARRVRAAKAALAAVDQPAVQAHAKARGGRGHLAQPGGYGVEVGLIARH